MNVYILIKRTEEDLHLLEEMKCAVVCNARSV